LRKLSIVDFLEGDDESLSLTPPLF